MLGSAVMTAQHFTLFDTPVGRCGIAWGERGVIGIQLPEGRELATRARIVERFPGAGEVAPPLKVQQAIDAIVSLLHGNAADLDSVVLDMEKVSPFYRRVYEVARSIPPGTTLSYGEIAKQMGAAGSARAVGQALGKNPFAIVVPCHRVLAAGGKVGGFSANGGIVTKLRLLTLERAHASGEGTFGFDPVVAIEHLRGADAALARVIDAVGPFRMQLKKAPSIFGALAESIVYQQLAGRAAATIFARVCALVPHAHEGLSAEQIMRLSDEKLRAAGLSRSKLVSLRDLAQKAVSGEIPTLAQMHAMDDDAIVESLTHVRGIGRWTVEMLLIFRLGRPDVLPVDDYGVRKGFGVATRKREMPTREALAKRGERWRPYRSVASWYLWGAADLGKK